MSVYLKTFVTPKDSWVDWYFNDIDTRKLHKLGNTLKNLFREIPEYYNVFIPSKVPCYTSWYPWNTFYNRDLDPIKFDDITIFYGGNGSGKTTLLNLIAEKLELSRTALFNKSPFWDEYVDLCNYEQGDSINTPKALHNGAIITSDDVFKYMLENRKINLDTDNTREQLLKDFYLRHHVEMGNKASSYVKSKLKKVDDEKSNGETAFRYFVDAVKDDTLILFDEPENSLSAQWQIELSLFLRGAVREFNCQFVIATHSPFILSIQGAKIYDLDSTPICTNEWYKLENVRAYYELFKNNRDLFDE